MGGLGPASPAWRPPEEFDEYRIVRELGAGAMGQVFLAHDTLLDRPVAVKFLGAGEISDIARERFLIEARALARLQHPNVVTVYRVGELGRRPYLVSEFIHGESLDKLAKPVPWRRVCELAIGLARGLAAAHRRGVLHRDIKPANTILASDDEEVKLLDFGLAKLVDIGAGYRSSNAGSASSSGSFTPTPTPSSSPPVRARTPSAIGIDATIDPSLVQDLPVHAAPTPVPIENATMPAVDDATMAPAPSPSGNETKASGSNPNLERDPSRGSNPSPSLTRDGAVMGTPYYMAPEAWRGEAATARADVYSLGCLLYELSCGAPPHRDIPVPNLAARVQVERARSLATRVLDIDAKFAAIVDKCLALDAADRYASADQLREALEALVGAAKPTAAPSAIPEGNPYRGLRTFEAEHRAVFFGRDPEVRAVVERMRTDPFVLVAGDSGVGKSSLVRAGVVPAILDGALSGGRTYKVSTIVPGRRPVVALAAELARHLDVDEAILEADFVKRDVVAIEKHRRALLRSLSKSQTGLLLVIDQLEELVTIADPQEADAAVELLATLFTSSARGIRLIATVRGDFLTRIATLRWFGDEIANALYVLRPMTLDGVREAIVGPARAKGVHFEPASMVDELAAAATQTSGSLPLLQFALAELWEARPASSDKIEKSALDAIGGVDGALARHADRVVDEMLPGVRTAARRLLLSLVSADGTRARRTRDELVHDDAAAKALESLLRGRLVSVRESEGEPGYELAHEALLSRWTTLRTWLDNDGEQRVVRRRIETAATEWERLHRSRELLWGARQLEEIGRLDLDTLAPAARDLVETSRRAIRSQRRRRIALIAAIPISILAIVLVIRNRVEAGDAKRRAVAIAERDRRVAEHVTAATTLQATVDRDRTALDRTRTDAFAKFDAKDLERGEELWAEAQRVANALDENQAKIAEDLEHALVIDPSRQDVRHRLAEILLARAELADLFRFAQRRDELLRRLALYDVDGSLRRNWNRPATVTVQVVPADARIEIAPITSENGRRVEGPSRDMAASEQLHPGGYILAASASGYSTVRLPLQVERGETLPITLELPPTSRVPQNFIYIPAGRFLVGTSDEQVRRGFLSAMPLHQATTSAYVISKYEVTYGEWIEFLDDLPPDLQARRRPFSAVAIGVGAVDLRKVNGVWRLRLQPTVQSYEVGLGDRVKYSDRQSRATHDWRKLPVSSISLEDSVAYVDWLRRTNRVPRARLCTEHEWERAARGADDREFPHGDMLRPTDANFDLTYGKVPQAMGPDEIGTWGESRSPFGVEDMVGNIAEWTLPSMSSDNGASFRGGSYYWGALTNRSTNRNIVEISFRNSPVGLRVCADP